MGYFKLNISIRISSSSVPSLHHNHQLLFPLSFFIFASPLPLLHFMSFSSPRSLRFLLLLLFFLSSSLSSFSRPHPPSLLLLLRYYVFSPSHPLVLFPSLLSPILLHLFFLSYFPSAFLILLSFFNILSSSLLLLLLLLCLSDILFPILLLFYHPLLVFIFYTSSSPSVMLVTDSAKSNWRRNVSSISTPSI